MILALLTILLAALLSIPHIVLGTECLVMLFCKPKPTYRAEPTGSLPAYKILMPAHNEASIIGKTLSGLIAQLPDARPEQIVVVADNCKDTTAEIALTHGVTVLERQDSTHLGKGFALDFGINYLRQHNPPDVLVIIDADCETTNAALLTLINNVTTSQLPAQMICLMRVIDKASIKQKIAGFAWLLKNKIRPLAMHRLGLPATLSGTGMAFPWGLLERIDMSNDNIVENFQLTFDCINQGYPPVLCSDAVTFSDFPAQATAELSQRTRWEHGHLQTIFQQLPPLVKAAFKYKNWALLAITLDIGVPPLSLLTLITVSGIVALTIYSVLAHTTAALYLLLLSLCYAAVALIFVWWVYGRDYVSAKELLSIPTYIISKLSLYTAYISKPQKEWVKTDRDA